MTDLMNLNNEIQPFNLFLTHIIMRLKKAHMIVFKRATFSLMCHMWAHSFLHELF